MWCIRLYRQDEKTQILVRSDDFDRLERVFDKLQALLDRVCKLQNDAASGKATAAKTLDKIAASSPIHKQIVEELYIGYFTLGIGEYVMPPMLGESGYLALIQPKKREQKPCG